MDDISGKTAFITGGASGIGFGMARTFLAAGLKVAIADVRQDHLDRAAAQIGDEPNACFLPLDVTDRAAMAAAADEAERRLGPVQILCNNAGVGVLGDMKAMSFDDWDWTLEVNIGGVVNGIQTFLPRMLARGEGGHIVNTSSIGGMLPGPGGIAYLTSKAAIIGLSEALQSDLYDDNIGVTVFMPGPTATSINEVAKLRPDRFRNSGLTAVEEQLAKGPIFPNGRDPLQAGEMVLKAIRNNQLFLFSHNQFRDGVEERFAAIMTGFPPGPVDEEEARAWGFPTYNMIYRDIVKNSSK